MTPRMTPAITLIETYDIGLLRICKPVNTVESIAMINFILSHLMWHLFGKCDIKKNLFLQERIPWSYKTNETQFPLNIKHF